MTVSAKLEKGGQLIYVAMKKPAIVAFPGGHPFCQVTSDEFPGLLPFLRGKMLPPDKGPCADNANGDLGKMAWEMQVAGRKQPDPLMAEFEWLIDALLPRGELTEDKQVRLYPIEEERSFGELRFLNWNAPFGARNNDPLITSGSLLAQPTVTLGGNEYLPVFYPEEIPLAGVGAIRAGHAVEAYLSLLYCNDGVHSGIAVFPDDRTMLSFTSSRTHPEVKGIAVLSDPIVMATQWLRRADQKMIVDTCFVESNIHLPPTMKPGPDGRPVPHYIIDEAYVDSVIQAVRGMVATASFYSPDHAGLIENTDQMTIDEKARATRMDWKGALTIRQFNSILGKLDDQLTRNGVASNGRTGIPVERIEAYLRKIFDDIIANGYDRSGPQHPAVTQCQECLEQYIQGRLPNHGFPPERIGGLIGYVATKHTIALSSATIPARIFASEVNERTVALAGVYLKDLRSSLATLTEEMGAKSIEQADAVMKMAQLIEKLGEGARRCGLEQELIVTGRGELGAFIAKTLPGLGYGVNFVQNMSDHLNGIFDPDSAENMARAAEQLQGDVIRGVLQLITSLNSDPAPEASEVARTTKMLIENLADGFKKFGWDNDLMKGAKEVVRSFVVKTLPAHGMPAAELTELKIFARDNLSPPAAQSG